jgi:hypothetical protein
MSTNAGNLLWNRKRFTLPGGTTDVDTGLEQSSMSFAASSVGEPPLGVPGAASPTPGALPASRVQVIPMSPLPNWANITHGEPYFNTTTNTVHVSFTNGSTTIEINALFWDPSTIVGPGLASTYNAPS